MPGKHRNTVCMKILIVIDAISKGGKERRMLELIKGLTQQAGRFEVYLIALTDIVEYDYVYKLPIRFEIMERKSKKDFGIVFKLRKIIKEFNPDIIHSWDTMSSVYLSLAKVFTNKKLINGAIANAYTNLNIFNKYYFRMKLTTPFSSAIVSNSKAGLIAYKAPASKSYCIYNGIDFNRFKNLKPASDVAHEILGFAKKDHFIGVMVAAFEDRKDYPTLISAAIKLCSENKKTFFLLIGEGEQKAEMQERVKQHQLEKQVLFLGKRNDVESVLQIADVGLLITPSEGMSNSIIEYMASGKPVIASKGGGTNELVQDGVTGFLVEQKLPDQIVEKIKLLRSNPELASAMGKKGHEWILENFNVSKMTDNYIKLYKEVLNSDKSEKKI